MNSLGNLFAQLLLGAVFYLLGIGVILIAGVLFQSALVEDLSGFLLFVMVIWTLLCLAVAMRGAYRMLVRGFQGG